VEITDEKQEESMKRFREIAPVELENAIKLIGKDWMLITVRDGEKQNAMTASWGSLGVLWNKNVCTVYIRPQRYTYGLIEREERFSISFMDESYREALRYCGRVSGRDHDKLSDTGLSAAELDGVPVLREARLTLICRKLYSDDIKKGCFLEEGLLDNYKDNDFHRFYICEIEKALLSEEE